MTLYISDTFAVRMLERPVNSNLRFTSITEENAIEAVNRRSDTVFRVQEYQAALLFTETFGREINTCVDWSLCPILQEGDHLLYGMFLFERSKVEIRGTPLFKPRIDWIWIQVD